MALTKTGRYRLLFAALYFSEGAPIGFIWWSLPTQLRVARVSVEEITLLTSILVLPWTLKFLGAPLIDVMANTRQSLKAWIISAQFIMAVSLLPLIVLDFSSGFTFVVVALLIHAIAASTQDAAIDTLAIRLVPSRDRGGLNGWMQTGMLLGRSLFGGVSLILLTNVDQNIVIMLLMAAVLSSALILWRFVLPVEEIAETVEIQTQNFKEYITRLKNVLGTKTTLLGLAIALMAGAAFEGTGAVAGPFLIDRGVSREAVGIFFSLPVIIAMMGGSLLGGMVADRISKRRAVVFFLIFIAVIVAALGGTDWYFDGREAVPLLALMALLYAGIGLFTASSYAFFMDITNPKFAATQFSAFMGATNMCESWSAFLMGRLAGGFGYPFAFLFFAALSLLVLPALSKTQWQEDT